MDAVRSSARVEWSRDCPELSIAELCRLRCSIRDRVGLTSGVFDVFHVGHLNYLASCKRRCGFLIVGVDADRLVRARKGATRPAQTLQTRLVNLRSSGLPDAMFVKEVSIEELLADVMPDICFFSSQRTLRLERIALHEQLDIPLLPIPYTYGISTSRLLGERDSTPHEERQEGSPE